MTRYRIMNRMTKEWWEGEARGPYEACTRAGWPIGDCWIREYSPKGSGGWKKSKAEKDCWVNLYSYRGSEERREDEREKM